MVAWTQEEVDTLTKAVEIYGASNWAEILSDPQFATLKRRTNVSPLEDHFMYLL